MFIWRNVKLWLNANLRITELYDMYANKRWIEANKENDFPIEIEIETLNRCNGTCSFCPVNVNMPQRKYAKMSEELFHKIVEELAERSYKGKISLYSNNEPLLDERIIDFHEYAASRLPDAWFNLYTNGSLLNIEKLLKLIKFLDCLVIDNYNDALKVNRDLKDIYEYLQEHVELKNIVHFSLRKQNEVLYSRGGQAPNKKDAKPLKSKCLMPFRQFVIRPDGKVSLCCNDALGKYTLGDVNCNSISEIWNGNKCLKIRREMETNGRKNLLLCKACDTRTSIHIVYK